MDQCIWLDGVNTGVFSFCFYDILCDYDITVLCEIMIF